MPRVKTRLKLLELASVSVRRTEFSPLGTATPGTFYLAGDGAQAAVRVIGGSARVRLMTWRGRWRAR